MSRLTPNSLGSSKTVASRGPGHQAARSPYAGTMCKWFIGRLDTKVRDQPCYKRAAHVVAKRQRFLLALHVVAKWH